MKCLQAWGGLGMMGVAGGCDLVMLSRLAHGLATSLAVSELALQVLQRLSVSALDYRHRIFHVPSSREH